MWVAEETDHEEEQRLIALARIDRAAFAPLYEIYALQVYRLCYRKVRNVELANDLTAAIFVRVLERLDQYRPKPGATFRGWLFTIARNVVFDEFRARRPTEPFDLSRHDRDDASRTPEQWAIHRSEMESLLDVVATLPERQQQIIHLRAAGLTTPEIATAMDTTVAAVKSAQSRAYAAIRLRLDGTDGMR